MKKLTILFVWLMLSLNVTASDIILGGWSHHPDRSKGYNETHYNVGVVENDWVLGYYLNSNEKHTLHIGKNKYFTDVGGIKLGVMYGMATGYAYQYTFKPFGLLKASYDYGKFGIDLHALPNTVYQINLRYKLGDTKTLSRVEDVVGKNWAVGMGYGLGHSISVHRKVSDNVNVQLDWNQVNHHWKDFWGTVEAGAWQREEIILDTVNLSTVYYLFDSQFGLYAGISYNDSEYKTWYVAHGEPTTIRGFNVQKDDRLDGVAKFDKLSYNAGIRYGNPFSVEHGWNWYVDIGITSATGLKGKIKTSFSVEDENLNEKINNWLEYEENKYSKYNLIPRVSIGLTYRFK